MSEYKRLTLHNLTSAYDYAKSNLSSEEAVKIYDRLAELEDKLESGKLLELLADVGDTIYVPWVYDGKSGIAHLPIFEITKDIRNKEEIYYHTDFETDNMEFAESQNYGICLQSNFGKSWFIDEMQAKSRLKELIKEASE